jgi:hypothetical protein
MGLDGFLNMLVDSGPKERGMGILRVEYPSVPLFPQLPNNEAWKEFPNSI